MAAIEHLTISLPAAMAAKVRGWVATGEFPDIDTAVLEALLEFDPRQPEIDLDAEAEWVRQHVLPAIERYDADPSRGLTVDQARAQLARAREARRC